MFSGPYGGGGYMGSGVVGNVGFYMGGLPPGDRRPYNAPPAKPYYGYREDNYNRRPDRRDDFRGGKRNHPKGRSPVDKRYHDTPPSQKRDRRPFSKRPTSFGRYEVRIPKTPFNTSLSSFSDIRHRYPKLIVASDFYECSSLWVQSFSMHKPYKFALGTDYHVFHRDVDPPTVVDQSLLDPPDVDYSYSARVMFMACPQTAELYKNTCKMADDPVIAEKTLPTKNIYFLVGGRAKQETMAIGGPWSPSLDGPDPQKNPKTLINTAIRTFKGYTGLDLSSCTEWIKFMEIKYYRVPGTKAPAFSGSEEYREITIERPEIVVFFIPNVAHMVPTTEQWEGTKAFYGSILQSLLSPEPEEPALQPDENVCADTSIDESDDTALRSDMEPTHYSKLDVSALKVSDLRNELAARGLDTKGLKVNLVTRLQSAVNDEKNAEQPEEVNQEEVKAESIQTKTTSPTTIQAKDESKELTEKERRRLERLYRLGDKPAIIIHPNKSAKGGRFDCHRVSLSSLLDYRTETQEEHNFEVSLFAEQFHEMIQRDSAFKIFKAVYDAPEKEHKNEQDVKTENGFDFEMEPDYKRRRNDSLSEGENCTDEVKVRRLRRTVDPSLLFAFTYFDVGGAGYIRETDLCELLHLLGLHYSRSQMQKLVSKVASRRDHVQYHNLTDTDIVEGDDRDVTTIRSEDQDDQGMTIQMYGNRSLFDESCSQVPAKIIIGGDGSGDLLARLEKAENIKEKLENQFYELKEELEKTRIKLHTFTDTEDALRAENRELTSRLKNEQKQMHEYKSSYNIYYHLLRTTRDNLDRSLFDINKQFEREKSKREAEKAAADAEKVKLEEEANKLKGIEKPQVEDEKSEEPEKSEEKEWEVVDAV